MLRAALGDGAAGLLGPAPRRRGRARAARHAVAGAAQQPHRPGVAAGREHASPAPRRCSAARSPSWRCRSRTRRGCQFHDHWLGARGAGGGRRSPTSTARCTTTSSTRAPCSARSAGAAAAAARPAACCAAGAAPTSSAISPREVHAQTLLVRCARTAHRRQAPRAAALRRRRALARRRCAWLAARPLRRARRAQRDARAARRSSCAGSLAAADRVLAHWRAAARPPAAATRASRTRWQLRAASGCARWRARA